RVGPELERRLRASISVQEGLLVVRDPIIGKFQSYFLPSTSPWVIHCGSGLSIVFGTSVTGYGSQTGNDVEVDLLYGVIDEKSCATLGPRIGKQLKSMLESEQAAR